MTVTVTRDMLKHPLFADRGISPTASKDDIVTTLGAFERDVQARTVQTNVDRAFFVAALSAAEVDYKGISAIFTDAGHKLGVDSVRNYERAAILILSGRDLTPQQQRDIFTRVTQGKVSAKVMDKVLGGMPDNGYAPTRLVKALDTAIDEVSASKPPTSGSRGGTSEARLLDQIARVTAGLGSASVDWYSKPEVQAALVGLEAAVQAAIMRHEQVQADLAAQATEAA